MNNNIILLMSLSIIQECQYSSSIDLLLVWSSFIYYWWLQIY